MPLIFTQPYFIEQLLSSNLVLLMHMEGTDTSNGMPILKDSSGITFTRAGAPAIGTPKFGISSLRLGSTGYIRSTTKPFANVGTKDFTFEFWVRINVLGTIGDHDTVNFDFYPIQVGLHSDLKLHFENYTYGWNTVVSTSNLDTSGAWTHVAVSRVSGTTRMFFNGKKVAESTRLNGINISQTGDMIIGARNNGNNRTTSGNYDIDEVRMIDGVGLYLNDFTPPTAPFSDSSISFDGWTVAWKQTNDSSYQINSWVYDVPLAEVQKATQVAIAYYDANAGSFSPYAMYSFAIPAEWKTSHPFNTAAADLVVEATEVASGTKTTGTLRYGNQSFATRLTDAWSGPGSNWGRIGITGTKAPFFNGFAASGADYASLSDEQYNLYNGATSYSSPTRRFVILIK